MVDFGIECIFVHDLESCDLEHHLDMTSYFVWFNIWMTLTFEKYRPWDDPYLWEKWQRHTEQYSILKWKLSLKIMNTLYVIVNKIIIIMWRERVCVINGDSLTSLFYIQSNNNLAKDIIELWGTDHLSLWHRKDRVCTQVSNTSKIVIDN